MPISYWSQVAGNNDSAPPNGAPEGMAPSNVNNCIRQIMADTRSWYENAQWIDFGHTPTKVDSDTFTVSGDQTSIYDVGRRVKFSGSVSGYGTIASSSYSSPNTTVNLTSAVMTGTVTAVSVGILSGLNNAIPSSLGRALTANETRTSTITLSNISSLSSISLEVGTYSIDGFLEFDAGPGGCVLYIKSASGVVSGQWSTNGIISGSASASVIRTIDVNSFSASSLSFADWIRISGKIRVTSNAVIDIQFSQNSSNVAASLIFSDSWIKYTKVL